MQKTVVTGGAGFVGSHVVAELVASGYEVHTIDTRVTPNTRELPAGVSEHQIDIRDTASLKPIFESAVCVFHTAALPRVQYSIEHPTETHDVNVNGTLSVLEAARAAKVRRVVYAASSSAYGDQTEMPLRENMATQPKSPYGVQKYIGELLCRTWSEVYDLETVSLRYFNVYGPGLDPDGAYALVIGKFLKQRKEGKPMTITGDGKQTRDFTHVRDVARANLLAMGSDKVGNGEVINIGAGDNHSILELADCIGGPVEYIEPRLEPKHTRADIAKAKELLGWEPHISFSEGVAELKKEWGI